MSRLRWRGPVLLTIRPCAGRLLCFALISFFPVGRVPVVIVSTCYALLALPLDTDDAVVELAAVKTPSCLASAPRFRCVWTDPYSRCLQNKRSLRPQGTQTPFRPTGIVVPAREVLRRPPAPPRGTMLTEMEWFCSCKINAHFCSEPPAPFFSALYPGGRGGARKT